jgi:hypothetical protein
VWQSLLVINDADRQSDNGPGADCAEILEVWRRIFASVFDFQAHVPVMNIRLDLDKVPTSKTGGCRGAIIWPTLPEAKSVEAPC